MIWREILEVQINVAVLILSHFVLMYRLERMKQIHVQLSYYGANRAKTENDTLY